MSAVLHLGDHGNGKDAGLHAGLRDDRSSPGPGPPSHPRSDENHVRPLEHLQDLFLGLLCRLDARGEGRSGQGAGYTQGTGQERGLVGVGGRTNG